MEEIVLDIISGEEKHFLEIPMGWWCSCISWGPKVDVMFCFPPITILISFKGNLVHFCWKIQKHCPDYLPDYLKSPFVPTFPIVAVKYIIILKHPYISCLNLLLFKYNFLVCVHGMLWIFLEENDKWRQIDLKLLTFMQCISLWQIIDSSYVQLFFFFSIPEQNEIFMRTWMEVVVDGGKRKSHC